MKPLMALAVVIVTLVAIGAWSLLSGSFDAGGVAPNAQNDSIGIGNAGQGGNVEQVIQKIIPKGPQAPEIVSNTWLNSPPLNASDLRSHVVVVELWTYG